jgi:proton-dependent oligopeptide transporter, POT family
MSHNGPQSTGLRQQLLGMGKRFWVANLLEAVERLAYYAVRAVLPLYLVDSASGGLGLSFTEKGLIFMVWAIVQCVVPMVSGGYTDSYGYRKSLLAAFFLNIGGYWLMAEANGFASMMIAGVLVGLGTAVFKPPIQGAVARSLNKDNSSLGFGIFYLVVNIGGGLAPMAAAWIRGDEHNPTWTWVFYGAAILSGLNIALSMLLFDEPPTLSKSKASSPAAVFVDTLKTLWNDKAMLRFLLVISGFWFMFMQVWDLLPNFLAEWVDARDVGRFLAQVLGESAEKFLTADGAAKPEILININPLTIIVLVLPLSWLFGKIRMIKVLVLGMAISIVGFVGAGSSPIGVVVGFMIFVFAIGEILCSPKFSEYIGMSAPKDRKALYMGYSNIPFAIGWAAGNGVSGPLYERFASKSAFAKRHLTEHGISPSALDGMDSDALMRAVLTTMEDGSDTYDATLMLWEAHHPWMIWFVLGAVGLCSLLGMLLLYRRKDAAPSSSNR